MKIVIASDNEGKLKEIAQLCHGLPIQFVPQSEYNLPPVAETGLSFIENAIIKARHASKHTELPSIADDSGLCADALGGAPGIFSARYAGSTANASSNMTKLLAAITNIKGEDRSARFHCAIAFVRHSQDPIPVICQAQWEGRILEAPVGQDGFGYDPIFWISSLNCTAAELTPIQKNQISHRAKALNELLARLKIMYPPQPV
jgi:XTP/dITP diphosphohydrolase